MKLGNDSMPRFLLSLIYLTAFAVAAQGQGRSEPQTDDVLRINTELIQTAITVTDGKGRFVEGLQRENFELRVDGKPQPISFFERIRTGSAREEQLTARDDSNSAPAKTIPSGVVDRGRTIIFFIDDLHLSLQSVGRTREAMLHFIEKEMGPRDMVAIASASGQIGFLQQFTNNKEVLRAAVARLNHRPYVVSGYGTGNTPMTEYMALTIDSKSDDKVLGFYVEACMKQSNLPKKNPIALAALRATCEVQVKNSARAILMQAANITERMYISLESLMRSSARLPGRKLAFFVSDGFLLDTGPRGAGLLHQLQQIVDAALRAGVVLYTIDARGLISGSLDATGNVPFDPAGRLANASLREVASSQDALNALARDTGGRALRNQNVFDRFVNEVLDETSNYYLLAWRPPTEEQKEKKFSRVEVAVIGRPDLSVRLPRGYVQGTKAALKSTTIAVSETENPGKPSAPKTSNAELRDALTDFYTRGSLPILLSLSYLDTPNNGMVLTSSMEIEGGALTYGADGKQPASVDLAGVVLNDKGKIVTSFKNHLNINPLQPDSAQADTSGVIYNHRAPLVPGIYQVRVAARDEKTGRVGSAMQWIIVPDLATRRLTLSSLLIDVRALETAKGKDGAQQIQFSVSHRFRRSSNLGFWVFIYNAMRNQSGTPDLTTQVQVLRDGKVIASLPQRLLAGKGMTDVARILYEDGLTLKALPAGRYELLVVVSDLVAKSTASQKIDFEVE